MITRRDFIKLNGITTAGLGVGLRPSWFTDSSRFESKRVSPSVRRFNSQAVEDTIASVKTDIKDPELAWLFENCYPNTLDTTVKYNGKDDKPDTFVITGDIDAMWLRDSSAQVWPYLFLVKKDPDLQKLILGVINRQAKCVLIDSYANAFNEKATGSEWDTDRTDMKPELHERKWEVDSLCYPIRLAYNYWKISGDTSFFDKKWQKAGKLILDTFKVQQRKNGRGPYHFQRKTEVSTDTAPISGYGNPIKSVGLICSIFRPSDDATIYPFLVPSNYFAVISLNQLAEMFEQIGHDRTAATQCRTLANEVYAALQKYAIGNHPIYGKVLAYEVDGFGNQLFMDDANVPSLLGLPYLGAIKASDPLYQSTRRMILSPANPYFYRGKAAEGIGGPHVGPNYIWPMSIIIRALTSTNEKEIIACLKWLKTTHAGTGFMHESFNKNNPADFTRKWFAWANTLFGELVIKTHQYHPQILKRII
ncbi:MAG TPA: glycoside hydrolase family 125 protein [Mucilaginibacter sp.]|nr:glycoside hydrolase family 125 protein [Mucilaginibacter sp.]